MGRFFFSLLLAIPFNLFSQQFVPDPDWRFDNFNSQNHFVSRQILGITTDKNGYVWACGSGVQRFDGFKTIEFNSFTQAEGTLKSNYTDAITDNNGRVWVSSSGLCYYDDASGKFVYVQPGSKRNITYAFSLFVQDNCLWFVCDYGLAKIDVRSLKMSFTSLTDITDPMCTSLIGGNTLLITSRQKVYAYDIKKNSYTTNILTYSAALIKVFAVAKSGKDIFLGTNKGLFLFKNLKNISLISDETKDITINDILFLPGDKEKKYLFLATDGKGLMIYNTLLKKIEFTYVHDDNNPFTLSCNVITDLFADKAGRLWIGTDLGISMLDLSNQKWKMRFIDKTNADLQNINRISADITDSTKVWMVSENQGMIRLNWKTKKVEKVFNTGPEMRRIKDFAQVSKNSWLLVNQKQIMEWDPRKGIIAAKKLPVPDSLLLSYYIRKIIMANDQTCFITTNKELFKYDLHTHKITIAAENRKDGKNNELIGGFYDEGQLWITSGYGLFNYDIATKMSHLYNGKNFDDYFFFDICKAGNNRVVCAESNGIAIFDKRTKSFKLINPVASLFNIGCYTVIARNNIVWIGTGAGILTYDFNTNRSARVQYESPFMEIVPRSPFAFIGKEMAVGFKAGYAYFTPGLRHVAAPSDPIIESVYVNNRPVSQQYHGKTGAPKLTFDHSNNSVNIAFTAFLYNDPGHINFRYRLKGANDKWQYTNDQRSANYAQLSPGNYTFIVQCGNIYSGWNNHLASVSFIILPPFWASWWFRTLVILVITLILYSLYRYKINHMRGVERMREKIASDFHDDIGSALSSISIFSEVANNLLDQQVPREKTKEIIGHISLSSRAMLDAMDDIVWAVNPRNDHLGNLAVRMREFAIPLLEASKIKFDINVQDDIRGTNISMEARKNIFMVFKECINNILKHSCCTSMQVSVKKLNNQLEFIIADNGKGFDIQAQTNRNGLKNIRRRANEIKGTLQISSEPGKGTTVKLWVNTI